MQLRPIVISTLTALVIAVPIAAAQPGPSAPRNTDADGRVLRDRPDGLVVRSSPDSDAFSRYLRNHVDWQSIDAFMRFLRNHPNGYEAARTHPDGFASAAAGVPRGDLAPASSDGSEGVAWLELALGLVVGVPLGVVAAGTAASARGGRLAHS